MRLTKYSQSCIRLETGDAVLVIDPGEYSEPESLFGAAAVLITHGHPDHLDQAKLVEAVARDPALEIYTNHDVADQLAAVPGLETAVRRVGSGDRFVAAGLPVRAFGGWHAVIHPDLPSLANLGFLIDGGAGHTICHPGDSFDRPTGSAVHTLLVPVAATWLRIAEAVEFVRSVAPRQAFGIHDAGLSELGHDVVTGNLLRLCQCPYRRLRPGMTA